jgi:lysozyme
MTKQGLDQLKRHEAFRARKYYCSAGFLTIGYGYNLEGNYLRLPEYELQVLKQDGIKQSRAEELLKAVVASVERDLYKALPWIVRLNEARQAVLINMAYNLKGNVSGLLKFKRTLALIEHGDYDNAADAMMQSKWADDVKSRAVELSKQMRTGKFAGINHAAV